MTDQTNGGAGHTSTRRGDNRKSTVNEEYEAALARMSACRSELLDLCARAHGTGVYLDQGPDEEARVDLHAGLAAPLSEAECRDLEITKWSQKWRQNTVGFIEMALESFKEDDFEVSFGPGLAAVDPNPGPKPEN